MEPVLHDIDLDKCLFQISPPVHKTENGIDYYKRVRSSKVEFVLNHFKERTDMWWRYSTNKNLHIIAEQPQPSDSFYDDRHFTGVLFFNNKGHHWAEPVWHNMVDRTKTKFFPTSNWLQIYDFGFDGFLWYRNVEELIDDFKQGIVKEFSYTFHSIINFKEIYLSEKSSSFDPYLTEFKKEKNWAIPRLRHEWEQFNATIPYQFKNSNHYQELIENKMDLPRVKLETYEVML